MSVEQLDGLLLVNAMQDDGSLLEAGKTGVLLELLGDQYIVEFAIPDESLVGGNRFLTALINPEDFAITGNPE